ncbi:MAG: class I SAM-dependent methyltransferase [Gammaproteobacteria bacterium]
MLLHRFFANFISTGNLTVTDAGGVVRNYGDGSGKAIRITLHSRKAEWRVMLNPRLAAGELYMQGELSVDAGSIYEFLSLALRNIGNLHRRPLFRLLEWLAVPLRHLYSFNPMARARKNVAHHYDLSSTLYDLFLDEDRQYSCAYFRNPDDTLEQAQQNKLQHIAGKLLLNKPGLRVLDIGSGWGGMGLFLARQYGCEVDGITLSEEQCKLSIERAKNAGLSAQVTYQLCDYRQQTGPYNRIVSVGMFEHVGSAHYREFFSKVRELLTDDGVMLLHSIGTMKPPNNTNPWIRKYIFPGGYTPSLSEVLQAVEHEGLYVTDIEIWRLHYAKTLAKWAERFAANRERVRTLYDERFCRMWEFYLAICQVAFEDLQQMVFQLQLSKDQRAVPLTRDYITEAWQQSGDESLQHRRAAD